ncbi:MAG: RNA methyltransferase [Planctomycetia bacterium]|nr:RNA methyltransferase [Planctomycetia bacterium]
MNDATALATAILAAGTITSPANTRVRQASRLRDSASRRETGLTLVDGQRELTRCLTAGQDVVEVFVTDAVLADLDQPHHAPLVNLLANLNASGIPLVPLAERPFSRIAFGSRNEGVVGVVRFRAADLTTFRPHAKRPVFILESLEKPGNIGAILRSADAAGFGGVILCGSGTDPANPAVIRASLGTVFSLPLASDATAAVIGWCQKHQRLVTAATPTGSCPWHKADLSQATILLGSEAHGISSAWATAAAAGQLQLQAVSLPMLGIADSLNVSATAAVLAYESLRQRQLLQ